MSPTTTARFTADALARLADDGNLHEVVKGVLVTMPPAGFEHGAIGISLSSALQQHVRSGQLGIVVGADTGFLLASNPDTVRCPDIGFVRRDRLPAAGLPRQFWGGAPDLAVEVVSPNDRVFEIDEKVQEWLDAGAGLVWVVNPRPRTVTVHRPGAPPVLLTLADTLEGGTVVGGFRLLVADIFVS